jgi:heme a synthase
MDTSAASGAAVPLVDLSPTLHLMLLAVVLAALPLSWLWLRQRGANLRQRTAALTALALFLTFDLVVFGSFTRLTDSGLGCPDWPGCYGELSPVQAHAEIREAESAMPHGPVTVKKAWIEMIHRYLAMTVGVLILVLAASSIWNAWRERRGSVPTSSASFGPSPSVAWPVMTLLWVIIQGLFGKYTVTLKLYPLVVTAHLLGGLMLLSLLMIQHQRWRAQPLALTAGLRPILWVVTALLWCQIALGGWVSTNYAVLACSGFPTCNGQWWPAMNVAEGFSLFRELGRADHGGLISLEALVAIHMSHRLMAVALLAALVVLVIRLRREPHVDARWYATVLGILALAQLASGLSNVVLGWPLVAALGHSAGAAALVAVTVSLLTRARWVAPSPSA